MKKQAVGSVRRKKPSAQCYAVAVSAMLGAAGNANAIPIDIGNPDFSIRWDNTVRYNLGVRTEKQDKKILNNSNYDDSDSKFDRGDIVTNRVDLLTEFDVSYKKTVGGRISATGWYDHAYDDTDVEFNPAFGSSNYPNNEYTGYVKRWNRGPSGEIMDAFVFGRFDLGSFPVDLRVGSQNVYWGQSLFNFVHGVSASQGPVDVRKASSNPGTEAKELFLPLNQVLFQTSLTDTVSIAAQYFLDWDPSRLPDAGTYLGGQDVATLGGGTYVITPAAARGPIRPASFLGVEEPEDESGDWGVMASWRPEVLDGTLGFYYREYTEKFPVIMLGGRQAPVPVPTDLRMRYLEGNKLLGISLAKEIGGVSVGAELVYRKNSALIASGAVVGDEPRGNTWHALLNGTVLMQGNFIYDQAILMGELTYSRLDKVTSNPKSFNGVGYGGCPTHNWEDGCATKDAWGLAMRFAPTWIQALPGVDISTPAFVNVGLDGNSAVPFGGFEGFGSYSFGVTADVLKKYNLALQYNDYLLKETTGVNAQGNPAVTSINGVSDTKDRGWVSFTFKTSF